MSYLHLLPSDLQLQINSVISMYLKNVGIPRYLLTKSHPGKVPESAKVFEQLYNHLNLEPDLKRKQVEVKHQDEISNLLGYHIVLQLPELSVLSPLRKKLNFVIAAKDDNMIIALTKSINDPTTVPEFILNELTDANIILATVLPVPEKKNSKYLVIFYQQNYKDVYKNEPLLVQLNFEILNQQWLPILQQLNYTSLITYLQKQFQICGFKLTNPFAESNECFSVSAHKGAKEGTLYFLPEHIIFGFKKPILLFSSTEIESITYTSITRITFNVTLLLHGGEQQEFSMIDQEEYDQINNYVQKKDFRDQSMADELKLQSKMKNNELEGILGQIMEGEEGQANGDDDDDDDEEDANYQFGAEESDDSGGSGSSGSESGSDDEDEDAESGDDDEEDEE